jgi:hypothetical protein
MVEAQRKNFDRIYSIELNEKFWNKAVKRFKRSKHIQILQGDSGNVLDTIIKDLDENAIFWLDGHYSSGDTAKGEKDCPIYEEIDAIFRYKTLNHILIIDDAGSFNGSGDYPTIDELTKHLKKFNNRYSVEVNDEIIRCVVN